MNLRSPSGTAVGAAIAVPPEGFGRLSAGLKPRDTLAETDQGAYSHWHRSSSSGRPDPAPGATTGGAEATGGVVPPHVARAGHEAERVAWHDLLS